MNVLVLSPRFPWPPYSGDRLRATLWLDALADRTNVALVAPRGRIAPPPHVRFQAAERSLRHATSSVFRGAPAHALLAAPYDWPAAIARAQHDLGTIDASIVLLSRLDPWVRAHLPGRLRLLDAIDSLGLSMSERANESAHWTKWFWRAESRRVMRAEAEAARAYDRVVVVSASEANELGAIAISNGVAIAPLHDAPRAFDFGFWGRLAYFANADAVSWLLDEIWPAIRAQKPDATLIVAGADAPSRIRAAHGRDGIVVRSPFDDAAMLARQIKVALFPVRHGTGQSSKVLEAAEGGCAIVATAKAMRGLDPLMRCASIAEDADAFARAAIAARPNRAARDVVQTHYARQRTLEQLAALVLAREAAA